MNRDLNIHYRMQNLLHTVLLLAGMLCLLGLIGWIVAGTLGVYWALITGATVIMSASRYSYRLILYLTGARLMSDEQFRPLNDIVTVLASRSQLSHKPKLYYLPSHTLQAFSTGMHDDSAIAISEGLLRHLDNRELIAVIAHELSHISSKDLWVMAVADNISRITSLMAITGYLLLVLYLPLYFDQPQEPPWLLLFLLVIAPTLSAIMQLALSRTREFNADMQAVNLTGDPQGLISALIKIERFQDNVLKRLFLPTAKETCLSLLRSHPLTEQRIQRLRVVLDDYQQPSVDPQMRSPRVSHNHFLDLWH